jgi:hypothetical protein
VTRSSLFQPVLWTTLVAALAGVGCSASADIPEVVVTQTDVGFDGVPRIPGVTDVQTDLETQFDHPSGMELPDFLDPELHPLSAQVLARDGMADLAFIQSLTLTLTSRSPDAPAPKVVASYTRPSTGTIGKTIDLHTDRGTDVLKYWGKEGAFYDLAVSGILPEDHWAVDVSFSFSGHLSVSSN